MARWRPRGLTALAMGLALAAAVASGCSAIPSGGGPQPASAPGPPGDGAGQCCGLLVRPPQVGWTAEDVVRYFLLASAIPTNDYAVARQYLTTAARAKWHPGTTVTILAQAPQLSQPSGRLAGPQGSQNVLVTGQKLATLSNTGQYLPASGAQTEDYTLKWSGNKYLIAGLLPANPGKFSQLLLTSDLFHLVYTPRNLYYYGLRTGQLLPYPVYVPTQGTSPPQVLVRDLLHGPTGWLAGAARTAFPSGTPALRIQVFPGPSGGRTAVVDIALPRRAAGADIREMAAQLVATLTNAVYGPPLFRAVKIKVNGRFWPPRHPGQALSVAASAYQRAIPHWQGGMTAYYLSPGGSLRSLASPSQHGAVVLRGPGTAPVALGRIAVSPNGAHLAGLDATATTVYTGNLVTSGPGGRRSVEQLRPQLTGAFTALSWDSAGDLWVAGRTGGTRGVWVLKDGQGAAVQVRLPSGLGPVTGLHVAPDGVRVALIAAGGKLLLAAAVREGAGFALTRPVPLGPSLPPVSALTWYDEDHLLVVTGTGPATGLWEVPVDGDNPAGLYTQAWIATVAAAGPDNPIYLGLATKRLDKAVGLNQPLADITAGQAVVYPG